MSNIWLKNGGLSAYGFAWGYIQTKTTKDGGYCRMWMEGLIYHVIYKPDKTSPAINQYFDGLNKARQYYNSIN